MFKERNPFGNRVLVAEYRGHRWPVYGLERMRRILGAKFHLSLHDDLFAYGGRPEWGKKGAYKKLTDEEFWSRMGVQSIEGNIVPPSKYGEVYPRFEFGVIHCCCQNPEREDEEFQSLLSLYHPFFQKWNNASKFSSVFTINACWEDTRYVHKSSYGAKNAELELHNLDRDLPVSETQKFLDALAEYMLGILKRFES